jgi:uncharacterized repeat protein (TIGR03803 family)
MTTALQPRGWFSWIRFLATSVALALQILLVATLVTNPSAQAQTFTILYSFTGGADGAGPFAGLIRDAAGNLYGTTKAGGDLACKCGTVFKLDTTGKETVLHSFTNNPDGAYPSAGLIRGPGGNLYGTTERGGAVGFGTVFKLTLPTGEESVLHSFTGGADGRFVEAGLVRDAAGNLYGTTFRGAPRFGAVFKVDAAGNETVLHSFTGQPDGETPNAALVRDTAGNLYGTTIGGGTSNLGTVFKLGTTGTYKVLHSFTGGADGRDPFAALVLDAAGNLYGTTYYGGSAVACSGYGCGTVFKVDRTGQETVLYTFKGATDGKNPWAGLVRDAAGNLYGTNVGGGFPGEGTAFMLDTLGNETVLHIFGRDSEGAAPYADLILDAAGNLYGTTAGGGAFGYGTVYKLTP